MSIWGVLHGCINVVGLIFAALLAFGWVSQRVAVARFRRRYRDRCLLLCGRRHGWYDFIHNNVAPALPPDCELVWSAAALPRLRPGGPKPLLVCVNGGRIHARSLHAELLPLRKSAAVNAEVQREVAEIIRRAMCEVRGE